MIVREVMSPQPATARPDTTVKQALAVLADRQVTSLPVVDRHGTVVGVVSEADLIRGVLHRDPRLHEILETEPTDRARLVEEVMTAHPVTVRPDTDLAEAVEVLTSTTVKSVPVVDTDGRLLGMLSRADVVRLLAREDSRIEAEVDELLRSAGLEGWLVDVHDGAVDLHGPEGSREMVIARVLAESVPGVVDVTSSDDARP